MNLDKARVPIIVGSCRFTQHKVPDPPSSVIDLMVITARGAAEDTMKGVDVLREVSTVACVGGGPPGGVETLYPNQPKSLANALGISARVHHQRSRGGCAAQATTTLMAQRIADRASGTDGLILLSGSLNALSLQKVVADASEGKIFRPYEGAAGVDPGQVIREHTHWGDDPGGEPEFSGTREVFNNAHERRHGLLAPVNAYPLYESRLRYRYGRSVTDHQEVVGGIMSDFSKVAADNFNASYSWYPVVRTKEEIIEPSLANRWVGWPYTKLMNAQATVDHSASWLMCSVATAERLHIPQDRWVYVHGGAYANQGDPANRPTWFVSQWTDYSRIPSMDAALQGAIVSSGITAEKIDHFDFYACFPSVVQMAADSLGMDYDDPRGLTVTGGLACYGQGGSMSAIVAMLEKLKEPGNRGHFGLVSGNGGLGQKHSAGVYSTTPPSKLFQEADHAQTQELVDKLTPPKFTESPQGLAEIVTYSVQHGRKGPVRALIIGKVLATGEQFIANTPVDAVLFEAMQNTEWIGRRGTVRTSAEGLNIFTPETMPQSRM